MPTAIDRRRFCLSVMFLAATAPWLRANAQSAQPAAAWPSRPVRMVVPGAPGGLFDIWARQVGDRIAPGLGQPIVPDHRVGAGGVPAMQHLARSAPDGHTFGICSFTQLAVNPWLFDKPAYDPLTDFAPVTALFASQVLLVTRTDSPIASLEALLEAARARPGRFTYGSSGVGQPPHVLFELVEHRAGVHLVHIPYRGGPAAVTGLLAGDLDLVFEGSAGLVQHVKSGRLRALAVTGERRLAALPDVPTFAESGVIGIDNSWVGIIAPAATPGEIVARMHGELVRTLDIAEVRTSYEASGRIRIGNTPEAFGTMIRESVPKWRELVKVAGLKPE